MSGLFMLFGIVKKNGILQVDYTNVLGEQGMPRDEAILEAERGAAAADPDDDGDARGGDDSDGDGRRPGAGARASMAKVILGGQLLSLLLSLLVTPVAYSLWDDLLVKLREGQGVVETAREPKSPPAVVAETLAELPAVSAVHLNGPPNGVEHPHAKPGTPAT